MTLPPVIRIFFAIALSETVKERLERFMMTLKKESKTNGIRWTKPDNLHITLQFLPTLNTKDLPRLIENVRHQLARPFKCRSATFGSLRVFPDPYRPRVIVLEILPQDDLAVLSKLIGVGIEATHYPIESRPYRAHLTLGRIRRPQDLNLNLLSTMEIPKNEKIEVNEVVLFRSVPQPEGSEYTVLAKMPMCSSVLDA